MKKVTVQFTSSDANKTLKNTKATFQSQTNASLTLGVPIPKLAQAEARGLSIATNLGVCNVLEGFVFGGGVSRQADLFVQAVQEQAKAAPVSVNSGRPVYKLSIGSTSQNFSNLTDLVNVMITSAKYDKNLKSLNKLSGNGRVSLYNKLYQSANRGKASTIDIFTVTKE